MPTRGKLDKHIEVIGIDHGWSGIKTVSQVFTTGVKEITTEPAFYHNIVEYKGSYYKVGGKGVEQAGNEKCQCSVICGTAPYPVRGGKAGVH